MTYTPATQALIAGTGVTLVEGANGRFTINTSATGGGAVSSVAGRTGDVVLTKTDVGLANVDNTSDANKPVSTATQTALNLKANLASPTFTGTVTLPAGQVVNGVTLTTGGGTSNFLRADGTYAAPTGGSGDVVGPASATDNAIARFDTTTGKLLQNSGASIDDSGNLTANNLSGTNTGDQTTISGNAGTATTLQTPRTIGGVSFNGSANIVPQTIESANEAADTTCFPLFITASGTQSLQPKNSTSLTFNASTGALAATSFAGPLTGNASTATALATGRTISISGDLAYTSPSFDGTGNVTAAGTLATVNSNTGSFGTATQSATININGKGLITSASNTAIQIAESQVTNLVSDLALKANLAGPTFTGTVTLPAGQIVNGVTLSTAQGTSNFLRGDGSYASPGASSGPTRGQVIQQYLGAVQ